MSTSNDPIIYSDKAQALDQLIRIRPSIKEDMETIVGTMLEWSHDAVRHLVDCDDHAIDDVEEAVGLVAAALTITSDTLLREMMGKLSVLDEVSMMRIERHGGE
jgi:hypothetical protein